MVLLTDVYRNLTSLRITPRERAFKQFKSPVLNVLRMTKNALYQLDRNVTYVITFESESCHMSHIWRKLFRRTFVMDKWKEQTAWQMYE